MSLVYKFVKMLTVMDGHKKIGIPMHTDFLQP